MFRFRLNTKSPIKKNIIANLFGVGVNLLNQIVLVPLYIIFWGNDLYADWIVLSAITIIFSMSDIGLNTVIQNRFSITLTQKNYNDCNALLTNNFLIVTLIFLISLLGLSIYLSMYNIVESLGLHKISRYDANVVLILIVIRVFLGMYSGIENAIYRATHHNSRCVYMDQASTLGCVVITMICLPLNINFVNLCILLCIPPIIVLFIKKIDAKKYYYFRFSLKDIDIKIFRSLIKPAIAFLSFPFGNALLLQGFTFIINKYYGADDVVSYNTTRTMCNFIIILLGTVQTSVWPEYSIAYGKGDYGRMRALHSKALCLTMIGTLLCIAFILFFGPSIYKFWTHGEVIFSYPLMCIFLIVILSQMIWTSSGVTLLSTNNHRIMGNIYIIGTILSFVFALICAYYGLTNIVGVAACMIIAHVMMDIYTLKAGIKLTQDNIKSLLYRNVRFIQRKHL